MWKDRQPNISYFHAFRCKCYVHNNRKEVLGKFDPKSDEGIFFCYSFISKAYRVHNKRRKKFEESIHVIFYETNNSTSRILDDDDLGTGIGDKLKDLDLSDKTDESTQ